MNTRKGYVVPVVLILVLLLLAGVFTFMDQSGENPMLQDIPSQEPDLSNEVSTTTDMVATSTPNTLDEEDDIATTTLDSSLETDIEAAVQ